MDIDDYLGELEHIVERVEVQRDLYHLTDQEDWSLEGQEGPVDEEMARYNIGPLDYIMDLWNKTHDAAMEIRHQTEVGQIDKDLRRYRKIQKKIFDSSDFLEEIYDLNKPLGDLKVEARYS